MGTAGKPSRDTGRRGGGRGSRSTSPPARGRQQARSRASAPPRGPRVSWSRRIGAGLGLAILGTSIVLAGQALDVPSGTPRSPAPPGPTAAGARPSNSGRASPEPRVDLAAPVLNSPGFSLVAAATVDIAGTLPAGLPRDGSLGLRIYVNDVLARERRLPERDEFVVRDLALVQGENRIMAALHSAEGEGRHGNVLLLTRDDVAPRIRLDEPSRGATVLDEDVTLAGTTEAGAVVTVTNGTNSREASTTADEQGAFELSIGLDAGPNALTIEAVDGAGNRRREDLTVTSAESNAQVSLTLSDESLSLSRLPATMTLVAQLTDEDGSAVDGADVTFSLSQPGQPTVTYRTTSEHGTAEWRDVRLPRGGALAGQGFATVMVVLRGGSTLQASATFNVR